MRKAVCKHSVARPKAVESGPSKSLLACCLTSQASVQIAQVSNSESSSDLNRLQQLHRKRTRPRNDIGEYKIGESPISCRNAHKSKASA